MSSLVRIQILKLVTVFKSYELKNIFVDCFSCFSVILIHITRFGYFATEKVCIYCIVHVIYKNISFSLLIFFSDLEFSSFAYEEICKHEQCSHSVFISSSCHPKFDFLDDCFFIISSLEQGVLHFVFICNDIQFTDDISLKIVQQFIPSYLLQYILNRSLGNWN